MTGLTILSLLLAIAVPTFVSQKSTAQATTAKANVKQVVVSIESCAASRVDGTYRGDDPSIGDDCLDPAVLAEQESTLAQLDVGTQAPAPGGYQVAPVGDGSAGYMVQGASESSSTGGPVWFAELHLPDGTIRKLCDTEPVTPADQAGGDLDSEGCSNGTW